MHRSASTSPSLQNHHKHIALMSAFWRRRPSGGVHTRPAQGWRAAVLDDDGLRGGRGQRQPRERSEHVGGTTPIARVPGRSERPLFVCERRRSRRTKRDPR